MTRIAPLALAAACMASPLSAQTEFFDGVTIGLDGLAVNSDSHFLGKGYFDDRVTLYDKLDVFSILSVRRKACIGTNCAWNLDGYSGTLKLHDFRPDIEVVDQSTGQDNWQLMFNDDSSNDAPSFFAINNTTDGTRPFFIDGATPSAALHVTGAGDVGLGTTLPQAKIHAFANASAGLRLTAYAGASLETTYELSSEYHAFTLRNQDEGTVPLIVRDGALSSQFVISADGRNGMGTSNPGAPLHVSTYSDDNGIIVENRGRTLGARGLLHLLNYGTTYFTLEDTSLPDADYSGRKWNFQNQNGTFRVTTPPGGAGEIEMLLEPVNGNMTIRGELFTGGSCAAGCDRVFDADYPLPSIDEQMAAIRDNGHLPNVGPTDENGPFNLSAMSTGMLNELEKAHLYIGQLHETVAAEKDMNEKLRGKVADLTARMEALEQLLVK